MNDFKYCVFDIETDGLEATKVHGLAYRLSDGRTGWVTGAEDSARTLERIISAGFVLVGHSIRRFDLPVLSRLGGLEPPGFVVDTLGVSWYLDQGRQSHSLESFGDDLGIPKVAVEDWSSDDPDDYRERCERDVEINYRKWIEWQDILARLYRGGDSLHCLRYLDFKMRVLALQEENPWPVNLRKVESEIEKLSKELDTRREALTRDLPAQPVVKSYDRPKKMYRADGSLSSLGERWEERLIRNGLGFDHAGPVEEVVSYEPGNPDSHSQVKAWLYELGWVPDHFKYIRNKSTGKVKEVPQLSKDGDLCQSVVDLAEEHPVLHNLAGYYTIKSRIDVLKGFLRNSKSSSENVDEKDGTLDPGGDYTSVPTLTARCAGFTNTLRLKHAELVNLPKPEKPYAEAIRSSLVAHEGYELCGADMSGLEDRIKQSFIYPYDPEYVESMQTEGFDPHLDLALLAGAVTQEDVDGYKSGDPEVVKRIKPIRSNYKNGNYACQYQAGADRISLTLGSSKELGKQIFDTYWKRNKAIKVVAEEQIVKGLTISGEKRMFLWNPVAQIWYPLRYMKDRFSTLVQGTAAYVFDLWVRNVLQERPQITAQFHDEGVWMVKKGHREQMTALLRGAIDKTNEQLGLNVKLDIGIQYGSDYAQIH